MLCGTALLPPIAADVGVSHDPPQPCFEVCSWLECPETCIGVEHGLLHQILRVCSIGGHPKSLPIEGPKKRNDGAFKLSAQWTVRHFPTFRAQVSHAMFLSSRKVLARIETWLRAHSGAFLPGPIRASRAHGPQVLYFLATREPPLVVLGLASTAAG